MPELHFTDAELDRLADLLASRLVADPGIGSELERAAVVKVPVLLTVGRVAEVLDCSPRTVRRRLDDGALPAVIEHGRTMVRGNDLRTYINGLERSGTPTPRRSRPRSAAGRFDFLGSGDGHGPSV